MRGGARLPRPLPSPGSQHRSLSARKPIIPRDVFDATLRLQLLAHRAPPRPWPSRLRHGPRGHERARTARPRTWLVRRHREPAAVLGAVRRGSRRARRVGPPATTSTEHPPYLRSSRPPRCMCRNGRRPRVRYGPTDLHPAARPHTAGRACTRTPRPARPAPPANTSGTNSSFTSASWPPLSSRRAALGSPLRSGTPSAPGARSCPRARPAGGGGVAAQDRAPPRRTRSIVSGPRPSRAITPGRSSPQHVGPGEEREGKPPPLARPLRSTATSACPVERVEERELSRPSAQVAQVGAAVGVLDS
jgi:hypothetical protein